MSALSIQKASAVTSAPQNTATSFEAFDVTNFKSASFQMVKSGAGAGTLKLQQSNDGSNWNDINTTAQPEATAAVSAGASSSMVSCNTSAAHIRAVFTENNTGAVTVVSGKYIGKQH